MKMISRLKSITDHCQDRRNFDSIFPRAVRTLAAIKHEGGLMNPSIPKHLRERQRPIDDKVRADLCLSTMQLWKKELGTCLGDARKCGSSITQPPTLWCQYASSACVPTASARQARAVCAMTRTADRHPLRLSWVREGLRGVGGRPQRRRLRCTSVYSSAGEIWSQAPTYATCATMMVVRSGALSAS